MPEGDERAHLEKIIEQLGAGFKSPLFKPHITLLGQVSGSEEEVVEKTATLAESLTAFDVSSDGLDFRDSYFQALFVKIKETPSLIAANGLAREVFQRESDTTFMPHLSLAYGDFDVSEKEEVIEEISAAIDFSFGLGKIHLYSTEGVPKDWQLVKSFPLKNP